MAKKGSVLVVDDEEIMRDVLETLLSSEGYRVDLAKTGEEGLDAYTKRPYDSVLLDVPCRGSAVARSRRVSKTRPRSRVIMITAYATLYRDRGLGERRVWLHSQPFQNEHIRPGRRRRKAQTQGRRATITATSDEP